MVQRRGEVAELVEGARLEIVYTLIAYQGFESPPLRHEKSRFVQRTKRLFSMISVPDGTDDIHFVNDIHLRWMIYVYDV